MIAMPEKKIARALLGGFFLLSLVAPGMKAQAVPADEETLLMADASPLSSAQMDETRGGFMDPSGLFVSFAVDVRTLVDGSVAFVRSLVLAPDAAGTLHATITAETMPQNLPGQMTITQVSGGKGVIIADDQGRTTALNQTPQGLFANIIMNTASNRNVTQNMDISIVLKNMHSLAGGPLGGDSRSSVFTALAQSARSHAAGLRF